MAGKRNIHKRTVISKWLYRHSKIGITGKFTCNKNINPLFFQSYLELGVLRYFALDNSVDLMDSQTGTMKWLPKGKKALRNYTPDIILVLESGELIFVEVKPSDKAEGDEKEKLDEIRLTFEQAGYSFRVVTEKEVPYEMFVNAGHLLQASIEHFETSFLEVIVESISSMLPNIFSFSEFHQSLLRFGFPVCPYGLIRAGYFTFDMKALLTPNTLIWRQP
jgi:hypothetical protein